MTDKNIAKKEKAIELMKRLDIYKPYIKGFRESDKVCFFEGFGGFWIDQEPEVYAKMKAIEKKYGCLVYAVTHEFTPFGECYSFLIVSDYPEEWDDLMNDDGNRHCAVSKESREVNYESISCKTRLVHRRQQRHRIVRLQYI